MNGIKNSLMRGKTKFCVDLDKQWDPIPMEDVDEMTNFIISLRRNNSIDKILE